MSLRALGIALMALALPAGASAQQSQPQSQPEASPPQPSSSHLLGRVTLSAGAATAVTLGATRDRFTNGAAFVLGASYPVNDRFAMQFEYGISFHDIKGDFFEIDQIRGTHKLQQFNFDGRWELSEPDARVRFYAFGGPGIYRRSVKISAYENSEPICDPYLLNCEVDTVTHEIGSRHTWDVGVNVGGGFTLPMSQTIRVAFEMRYIHIWGPTAGVVAVPLAQATSGGTKVNGDFLPLMVSFRF